MPDDANSSGAGASASKVVFDRADLSRTVVRIAHEIVEKNGDRPFALIGIHRRGVPVARRLAGQIADFDGREIPVGELDISFYRDDIGQLRESAPVVHSSSIDFSIDEHVIVLVDDVLYTGRTVRAAIDALFDFGRPPAVQLAVLADRGHRELPIRPDFVGKNLPTSSDERVNVRVEELDGVDEIAIVPTTQTVSS
ncbi:MAG: bifunctional pyr operon transcriptional regulator/uracil phosphoribosyltransferase PyrR [Solirubrobacterales bacterium]|nr:bifunctional pyr operon transcriptional regulator/uracil phosphoribosyltransferase PyrR [Solirubrobacterales bacterium]